MKVFRKKRIIVFNAIIFSALMILDMAFATVSFALTGGPSQPEVSSFTPVTTSDLVNLSSGDFSYNIPLMDVGGYPINISYNSGISMDEEASWVGLGWNLNPGVINRNMRALPDDFNGLGVRKEFNMKTDRTYGLTAGANAEVFGGAGNLGLSLGVKWNNYNGVGVSTSTSINASMALPHAEKNNGAALDLGLSLNSSSDTGLDISPSVGLSSAQDFTNRTNNDPSLNVGLGFNSRAGFKGLTLSGSTGSSSKLNARRTKRNKRVRANSNGSSALSSGTTISLLPNTYSPVTENSRDNLSLSFNLKLGPDVYGTDVTGHIEGYYSRSKVTEEEKTVNSYGYLFAHNSTSEADQHDFNRENDSPYTKDENRLPLTNQTYDIFSASGQGMSGMFRPYRNDVGVVFDPLVKSSGTDGSAGIELGFPAPTPKIGGDITINYSNSHTGRWNKQNEAAAILDFERKTDLSSNYEPSYFREVGELAVDDEMLIEGVEGDSFFEKVGGNKPVRVKLQNYTGKAQQEFVNNTGDDINFPSYASGKFRQEDRKKRNKLFSYLSVRQSVVFASRVGNLKFKDEYNSVSPDEESLGEGRVMSGSEVKADYEDQIGEITILQNDGSRYIYGKPLYNTLQREVTFNASSYSNIIDAQKGTVTYDSEDDASLDNENGLDHYFSSTELPPFAHSYMITEILSTDYSDSDNTPGPSLNDYGSYTLFNYKDVSDYKWRTPYENANHNEGFRSVATDDQGSYIYGEKDLAYLESIQSKTHIAFFHKTERHDALSASHEHPSENNLEKEKMLQLDRIELFTLADYNENGADATPIKTAHFTYDYLLGSGVHEGSTYYALSPLPNNDGADEGGRIANQGGKLTLRSVYFTYRKSHKAKFSKYDFSYDREDDTNNNNYTYDIKAYDVWGNYKPSNLDSSSEFQANSMEFPYVEQFEDELDVEDDIHDYATAWHLTQIKLPSGGTIKVDYESDDYLYVQDKRAMQMFKVLGASSSPDGSLYGSLDDFSVVASSLSNELYSPQGPLKNGNLWTCVASEMPLSQSEWSESINGLTSDEKVIQFRYLVNVFKDGGSAYEYVSGYGKLDPTTLLELPSVDSKYAWIKFKGVNTENKKNSDQGTDHPVSKAAWNFTRKFLPKRAYNQPELSANSEEGENDEGLETFFKNLAQANILGPFKEALKGPNGYLKSENKSRSFKQGLSWVRLNCPKDYKFGGGSRVKTIVSNDNWTYMSDDPTAKDNQFGQEYIYKTASDNSSGVASFEPLMSKENPWVVPVKQTKKNRYIIPSMKEEPIGSSFFPSPSITYSRVQVKEIIFENNNRISEDFPGIAVASSRTGSTVNEFYTTKDFPTKVTLTRIEAKPQKSTPIGGLTQVNIRDLMAVSQGYQIEINDMDGKPKSTRIYGENQLTAISGVDYLYEESQDDSVDGEDVFSIPSTLENIPNYTLNNEVIAINSDGTIKKTTVGVEVDVVSDFRESLNTTRSIKTKGNMSVIYALIVPVPVPTVFPNTHKSRTRFRSSVITKVINRRGILRETVAFDNGASVSTKNLAYDANTGAVLLTSTKNEFGDEIFNLNVPAYWAYEEMGQASENIGYSAEISTSDKGKILIGNSQYLVYGDELAISDCVQKKGWVWHTQNGNVAQDSQKYIIDAQGNPIEIQNPAQVSVIKSGYKNMHGASMSSMTLMENPLLNAQDNFLTENEKIRVFTNDQFNNHKVIDVSAIEYSDRWKGFDSGKLVDQEYCDDWYGCSSCLNCPDKPSCSECGLLDCSDYDFPEPNCWTQYDVFRCLYNNPYGLGNNNQALGSTDYYSFPDLDFDGDELDEYQQYLSENSTTKSIYLNKFIPSFPFAANVSIIQRDFQILNSGIFTGRRFLLYLDIHLTDENDEYISHIENVIVESFQNEPDVFQPGSFVWNEPILGTHFFENESTLKFYFNIMHAQNGEVNRSDYSEQGAGYGRIFQLSTPCGYIQEEEEEEEEVLREPMNPFVQNFRGQFRPVNSYAYLGERNYEYSPEDHVLKTNVKTDGVYASYSPYWLSGGDGWSQQQTNWTWTSAITGFNPFGPEVENVNALGQLSSALFGYHQTLPTAVAANASYNQIASDNFEDYFYEGGSETDNHFSFRNYRWYIEHYEVHTGKYSLRIPAEEGVREISCKRKLDVDPSDNYCTLNSGSADPDPEEFNVPYYLRPCDELGRFGPQTFDAGKAAKIFTSGGDDFSSVPFINKQYVLSYWVHEKFKKFDMNSSEARVLIDGAIVTFDESKESEIINGWKKYDHVFTISESASEDIEIIIRNNRSQGGNIYVDDLRIHPLNSSMKSYVYNPENLRLVAELDDNNFATFYEYDEEGRLLRIKKETERGIVTIQESKTHTHQR